MIAVTLLEWGRNLILAGGALLFFGILVERDEKRSGRRDVLHHSRIFFGKYVGAPALAVGVVLFATGLLS